MDVYNAEHYRDTTAALAVARADRGRGRRQFKPVLRWPGLTYAIGEVVTLVCVGGTIWMAHADAANGRGYCRVHKA